jgi:hypothetical protein
MVKINTSIYGKNKQYKQDACLTEMEEGGCLIETTELRTESGTLVSSFVYVFEDVTLCGK